MKWPNARDWIGLGTFGMSVMVLWMMAEYPVLREDEFFQTIATAIIMTGFLGGPVSWAYAATKGGTELADRQSEILHEQSKSPQKDVVENPYDQPVPEEEKKK